MSINKITPVMETMTDSVYFPVLTAYKHDHNLTEGEPIAENWEDALKKLCVQYYHDNPNVIHNDIFPHSPFTRKTYKSKLYDDNAARQKAYRQRKKSNEKDNNKMQMP